VRAVLGLAVALTVAPAAAAGWIQITPKRTCGALPDGYVCSTKTQVSFGYPASWNAFAYNDGGLLRMSLIWVSTEPFREPCTTVSDGVGTTVRCRAPVEPLRRNGIAAAWYIGGTRGVDVLPGTRTTIAGFPARVQIVAAGCPDLGGDERITAWIETKRTLYTFFACLRGPELAYLEAQAMTVLHSARFPYG
jgi:hypothetical protein